MLKVVQGNVNTALVGDMELGLIKEAVSYLDPGRYYMPRFQRGEWDGRHYFVREVRPNVNIIPSGLTSEVVEIYDRFGIPYTLEDKRTIDFPDPVTELAGGEIKLWPHQAEAVEKACEYGRGIINLPTGSGKTFIAAAIIKSFGGKALFLVHRQSLLFQTKEALEKTLGEEVGVIGHNLFDLKRVTVAMIQSIFSIKKRKTHLPRLKDYVAEVNTVIYDEVHNATSISWRSVASSIKAPHRFGLSATVSLEEHQKILKGLTGPIIYALDKKDLFDRGVIIRPTCFKITIDSGPDLTGMRAYNDAYEHGVVRNEDRNAWVPYICQVLHSHDLPTLVLTNRVGHAQSLSGRISSYGLRARCVVGAIPREERRQVFRLLREKEIDIVVATAQIAGEGFDEPFISALVNATGGRGGGSPENENKTDVGKGTRQFIGRVMRAAKGKKHCVYVDFDDKIHPTLKAHSKERWDTIKSEGYTIHRFSEENVKKLIS